MDRENTVKTIQNIANDKYRIVIDSSSLLEPGVFKTIGDILLEAGAKKSIKLVVFSRSVDELLHLARKPCKKQVLARRGLEVLKSLQDTGYLSDIEDPFKTDEKPFDCRSFIAERFVHTQLERPMCLITQDRALAQQVLFNAKTGAIRHRFNILAYQVTADGLTEWRYEKPTLSFRVDIPPLSEIARDFLIIPDTSAMMCTNYDRDVHIGEKFFRDKLLKLLVTYNQSILLANRVRLELVKHRESSDDERVKIAQKAIDVVKRYETEDCIMVVGEENELAGADQKFADPVFIQALIRFQSRHNLCFITQDAQLAEALLVNRESNNGKRALVTRLHQGIDLMPWEARISNSEISVNKPALVKKKALKKNIVII